MKLLSRNCLILIVLIVVSATSCVPYKNVPYFKDLPDSARATIINAPYKDLIIRPDDILNINIQTIDPNANAVFGQNISPNQSQVNNSMGVNMQQQQVLTTAYLVDKSGQVEIPLLGKISLGGLTTSQARDTIQQIAAVYYKIPTVNVRFANFKVTVLGEVARPGTYILANEKNTIFDALGLAGDLTIFGKRENLLLIRDSAGVGQSQLIRFSLNSKDLIRENFFYLRQNDVIYVEPTSSKIASLDANRNRYFVIAGAILSVLIVAGTRIK